MAVVYRPGAGRRALPVAAANSAAPSLGREYLEIPRCTNSKLIAELLFSILRRRYVLLRGALSCGFAHASLYMAQVLRVSHRENNFNLRLILSCNRPFDPKYVSGAPKQGAAGWGGGLSSAPRGCHPPHLVYRDGKVSYPKGLRTSPAPILDASMVRPMQPIPLSHGWLRCLGHTSQGRIARR